MGRPIVENKIAEVLKSHPKGSVLFVDNFLDYGNQESVKKALLRLKEKKILVRLAHGIYLYPKIDKELGVLFPSTEDIAKAIARRDRARIVPTGVQALNKLGLSTQNTSPKNLMAKGEISSLVIQALKTIGQLKVDDETLLKIQTLLQKEKIENRLNDAKLAPAWINKIIIQTIK